MLVQWDLLPDALKNDTVRLYYEKLEAKKGGLIAKRLFDIVVSAFMIAILSPVLLLLAILIKADSKGPVFYRQERVTAANRSFRIFKFRTMVQNADQIGALITAEKDPRITKMGNRLRKCRLDELPQLYNVLLGSMSFVGPRPELLRYTEAYQGEEKQILEVRPGITDFSSIEFISLDEIVGTENADEMYEKYVLQRKNRLRIRYAQEVSLRTDVYLFFKTVGCVLKKALRIARAGNGEKA